MEKLKKLGIILVLGMVMILAACGSSETGTDGDGEKTLRVVTDAAYSPMEYLDGDKVVGFDIDFVKAVAEEAGYELQIDHVG